MQVGTRLISIGAKSFAYSPQYDIASASLSRFKLAMLAVPWPNTPPFVAVTVNADNHVISTHILPLIESFRYDEAGQITGIPWKIVLKWAALTTLDGGVMFLEHLTVNTLKTQLCKGILGRARKRVKTELSFSEFCSSQASCKCTGRNHNAVCGTSPIILSKDIDEATYSKTHKIVCKRCVRNAFAWSSDGFFNREHADALLNVLPNPEQYSDVVKALRIVFQSTKDTITFYRCMDPSKFKSPADVASRLFNFKFSLETLLEDWISVYSLLNAKNALAVCMKVSPAEALLAIDAVLCYQLFGSVELLGKCSPFKLKLAAILPTRTYKINTSRIELVVVPVLDPSCAALIFKSTTRRVKHYTHTYNNVKDQLYIPGVPSIAFDQLSQHLDLQLDTTVVVWPAHTFTGTQLEALLEITTNNFILSGVSYVVAETPTYGQVFTRLLEEGVPFTSVVPPALRILHEDTYPLAPIAPSIFPVAKMINLLCPVFKNNTQDFYYRFTLSTLLYRQYPFPFQRYGLQPGPLAVELDIDRVTQSKTVCPVQSCVLVLQ